jgi:hypothetical protein
MERGPPQLIVFQHRKTLFEELLSRSTLQERSRDFLRFQDDAGLSVVSSMKKESNSTIVSAIKSALTKILPKDSSESREVDALSQICVMGVVPNGDEDPTGMMKLISDKTLNKIASDIKSISRNPVIGRVSQFFVVEWGLRNGYIEEWRWTWDGPTEGHMSYRPNRPLNEIIEFAERAKSAA